MYITDRLSTEVASNIRAFTCPATDSGSPRLCFPKPLNRFSMCRMICTPSSLTPLVLDFFSLHSCYQQEERQNVYMMDSKT